MAMKRIHSVDFLPSESYDNVSMRVDTNKPIGDIVMTLQRLVDWCLDKGVKKVMVNSMDSVHMMRSISNDQLDVQFDSDQPAWDIHNDINYII